MPLETGEYIDDLVITNPPGTDPKSQGDDHLRLLKKTVQQSFPNIDGAVTHTAAEMNNLLSLAGGTMTGDLGIGKAPVVSLDVTGGTSQGTHPAGGAANAIAKFDSGWLGYRANDLDNVLIGNNSAGGFTSFIHWNGSAFVESLSLDDTKNASFSGNVSLLDNKHFYAGTGNDLSMHHDGANTYINNNAGLFIIEQNVNSTKMHIQANDSGGTSKNCIVLGGATPNVILYYDGSSVFQTVSAGVRVADNQHFYAGAGNDLDLYHNGTDSKIENSTGGLQIQELVNGGQIKLTVNDSGGTTRNAIVCGGADTDVTLYHKSTEVFKTVDTNTFETGTKSINFANLPDDGGSLSNLNAGDLYHEAVSGILKIKV